MERTGSEMSRFRGYRCVAREYRFDQIIVGTNDRTYMGDLPGLGRSLDKGQFIRMIGVPEHRNADNVVMYDGLRRHECVKLGYAPKFAARNRFRFDVLVDENGDAAPEDIVLDYMAEVNQRRQNWSPIEMGRHYHRKIERAITVELEGHEGLTEVQVLSKTGRIRSAVIRALSRNDGVSARTIRYRLELIELPGCVQVAVASGMLSEQAARGFKDLDDKVAERLLKLVAKRADMTLADIVGEEGRDLLPPEDGSNGDTQRKRKKSARMKKRDVEAAKRDMGLPADGSEPANDGTSGSSTKTKNRSAGTVVCERRPDSDVKAQVLRLSPLVERGGNPRARLALQVLRWCMSETDEFPI